MNLLEVNNICKTYGSGETAVHALKKVSFSVPKGEYVAIVGESGSGKSTLLNMIGALDTPTSGRVTIGGMDIFSMDERKLTVFRRTAAARGNRARPYYASVLNPCRRADRKP